MNSLLRLVRPQLSLNKTHTIRSLSLHEYQSMKVLESYNVTIPKGIPASTPAQAKAAFKKLSHGNK